MSQKQKNLTNHKETLKQTINKNKYNDLILIHLFSHFVDCFLFN